MLTYAESRPDARLRPFVQSFWTWDAALSPGERFVHHVWPDGCVMVVVNFAPGRPATGTVVGPGVEPRRIVMQGRLSCRGLRFRPEAGAALLGLRAADLCDRSAPLIDAIGPEATALVERVAAEPTHRAGLAHLRTWLRRRLAAAPPSIDPLVSRAVDTLAATHGQAGIKRMADELRVSTRQLERRFQLAVGLTPKQYARIRRMRSLLAVVLDRRESASWAAIATELGYADQAHCARELSRLTGLTPRALATRLRAITHHAVRP